MQQLWEQLKTDLSGNAPGLALKLLVSIIALVVGLVLIRLVKRIMQKAGRTGKVNKSVNSFLVSFVNIVLIALLITCIALYLGVPSASILALIGSAGLALGLALQGSLSNLAGGIMILLFKPFLVDDYILTADGHEGTVQDITILYTTLITADGKRVVLPNSTVSNNAVVNFSSEPARRMDIDVSVAYGTDAAHVRTALLACVSGVEVLDDPAPCVLLSSMEDSALRFTLRVWCPSDKYLDVKYALTQRAKDAMDAAGIDIPFPQLDVRVKSAD